MSSDALFKESLIDKYTVENKRFRLPEISIMIGNYKVKDSLMFYLLAGVICKR